MNNEELLTLIHSDNTAIDKLIQNNQGLVFMIAKKFLYRGYDMEELVQLGNIGLFKAIKKYNPSLQTKFSTYAVPMIMGEIRQFLRNDKSLTFSRYYKTLYSKILSLKEHIFKTSGYEPTLSELSHLLNVSYDQIVVAINASTPPDSIQKTLSSDKNESFVIDTISDNSYNTMDTVINKIILCDTISSLSSDDKKILHLRFIRGMTQSKIAKLLNISQVKVSRKLKKFFQLLRQNHS